MSLIVLGIWGLCGVGAITTLATKRSFNGRRFAEIATFVWTCSNIVEMIKVWRTGLQQPYS
eukprot:2878531-Amphidinium_carterae.1